MKSRSKTKNHIRLKKKQSLYALSDNVTEYYPRTGGSWVMMPFLIIGAGFLLVINLAFVSMFKELTWEMFFSFQMIMMAFIGLMLALPLFLISFWLWGSMVDVALAKEPLLVLTPEGLYHRHSTQSKHEFVAWSEIDAIWVYPTNPRASHKLLKLRLTLKATASEPASVTWVDFLDAKCEEYTLYQNVLKYWRQYRGDNWQGNPNIPETGWRS